MPSIKLYPTVITTALTWNNPDNAKLNDGVYATTTGARNTNYEIIGSNFDLSSIPAGSIINSVALEVEYKLSTTASAATLSLIAVKNGSLDNGTAVSTTTEPLTDTIWQNTTTGSYTLETLAQLGVLFRVRRTSNTACTYSVDYLAIEVDYTGPTYNFTDSAEVTGVSSVVADGIKKVSGSASVSGVSSVVAEGFKIYYDFTGSASVSGVSSVVADGIKKVSGSASVSGVSSVIAVGVKKVSGSSSVSVVSNVSVSGSKSANGAGQVISFDGVDSLGSKGVFSMASVSSMSEVSAIGVRYGGEITKTLLTVDEFYNLVVAGEIVEGSTVNLDSTGVLTVVEIIEGSGFSYNSSGVLTVNTVTEGGIA